MTKQKSILNRSKISERKFREIVRYFVYDIEAKKVSELVKVNRKTVNSYYTKIRKTIAHYQEEITQFSGELVVKEKVKIKEEEIQLIKYPYLALKKGTRLVSLMLK